MGPECLAPLPSRHPLPRRVWILSADEESRDLEPCSSGLGRPRAGKAGPGGRWQVGAPASVGTRIRGAGRRTRGIGGEPSGGRRILGKESVGRSRRGGPSRGADPGGGRWTQSGEENTRGREDSPRGARTRGVAGEGGPSGGKWTRGGGQGTGDGGPIPGGGADPQEWGEADPQSRRRSRGSWGQTRGRGERRTLRRGRARGGGGPSPAQPLPARPRSLGMKPPVVRARPADPAALGPALHLPGSRVGGKERRGSGAWLPAKAAAFGPGATRRPRLGGGRGERRPGGSSAMGSRSSHAARIPDVDSIRRETGCECGARRPGVRRGPGRSGPRAAPGEPRRSQQPGSLGVGGAFTQGSRLRACGRPGGPGPALRRTEADRRGGFGLPDLPGLVTPAPSLRARPWGPGGALPSASPPPPAHPLRPPGGRRVPRDPGASSASTLLPRPPSYQPPPRPAVSQASLLRLYHRFRALDRTGKGYLR